MHRSAQGVFLVTGPAGAGKSTTLYSIMREFGARPGKTLSVENPIEVFLPEVLQLQVDCGRGLTVDRILDSVSHHDPDAIFVSEMDDSTAAMSIARCATLGYRVVAGVLANSAIDTFSRLDLMGVDSYLFSKVLRGILSQRLIRLVCRECAVPDDSVIEALREEASSHDCLGIPAPMKSMGCPRCGGTGFYGAQPVGEVLCVSDEIRELIVARASVREIKAAARRNGTRFLRETGLALAFSGRTTLDEVNRVVGR